MGARATIRGSTKRVQNEGKTGELKTNTIDIAGRVSAREKSGTSESEIE